MMKGQRADGVTSSGSMDILTGINGVPETAKQRDMNHNTLTTVEITPVKAPSEIQSAIRRQKRTETLDYIWHALPVSRSSKPLYRAVLRGSLNPGSIQYTITNVSGGPSLKTSINGCPRDESSSVSDNDVKSVSHSGFGLRVAGLSINEIKFQEPTGRLSPRTRLGQAVPVSRHMKQNFLEQKSSSSANGFKSRKPDYGMNLTEDVPRSTHITSPTKHFNGISQSKPTNGYSYSNKLPHFISLVDEESNRVIPLPPSLPPSPVAMQSSKEKPLFQTSVSQKGKTNEMTSLGLTTTTKPPHSAAAGETQIKTGREIGWYNKTDVFTFSDSESSPTQRRPSDSANQASLCKRSPRPVDASYSTQGKESSSTSAHDLTCLQLADTILGAVNGDLSQVYSLCKSKLRYSDFIEQSQPHRLGEFHSYQETADDPQAPDPDSLLPVQGGSAFPETPQTKSAPPNANTGTSGQPPSTLEKTTKESTRLPLIKTTPKSSYQHVTSRYLNFSSGKILHGKDADTDTSLEHVDTAMTFGKAGRPILKTCKSDVESNSRTRDDHVTNPRSSLDPNRISCMDANNNANGVPSNRLVRFNTCHEVREFTPSEPIRQH